MSLILPHLAVIDRTYQISNYIEAGLWISMGIGCLLLALVGRGRPIRLLPLVAAVVLIAFGGSDIVEAHTGAWWDPWWLLVWKGVCVAMLLGLVIQVFRQRKLASSQKSAESPAE